MGHALLIGSGSGYEGKIMKFKSVLVLAIITAIFNWADSVPAQELSQTKVRFAGDQVFRVFQGKIYNVVESQLWRPIRGSVFEIDGDILILNDQSVHMYSGIPDYLAVKNFRATFRGDIVVSAVIDNYYNLGVRIGTYNIGATPIPLYDCGTPYIPPPQTPEQIAAAKEKRESAAKAVAAKAYQAQANAVRWLQPQATNGDASAQFSLGSHYLQGKGCESNLETAIYWFRKAADQGSLEASNKLAQVKATQKTP